MTSLKKVFKNLLKEEQEETTAITDIPEEDISVDRQILRAIMNAERSAVQAGKQQQGLTAVESVNKSSLKYLLEQDGDLPPLDIGTFAIEIMRVIKNFDTILDIPAAVYYRAKQYVNEKYGADLAKAFEEYIDNEFNFAVQDDTDIVDEPPPQHFAVGATSAGGGAGV